MDILHDHFLIQRWREFSPLPFREFVCTCNRELLLHRRLLPSELGDRLEERIADDWLGRCGSEAGLDEVFRRVAERHPAFRPIRHALDDLRRNRGAFAEGFERFFPELIAWIRKTGPEAGIPI